MRVITSYSVISLVVSAAYAEWLPADESGFREAVNTKERTLVAYISPAHESYKSLERDWSLVQSSEDDDTVISVDCSDQVKLCRELDVVSFPAIRLHRKDGTVERYRGPRKAKEHVEPQLTLPAVDALLLTARTRIKAYLQRMKTTPMAVVNESNMTSFWGSDDVVFVAQFSANDPSLEKRYLDAAYHYRDRYSFAVGPQATHSSSLRCTNNANQEQLSIEVLSDMAAIDSFIRQCARPLVPELTRRNEAEYMRLGKSIVHYFVSDDQDRETYVAAIKPLAKKLKEYLVFATTDVSQYPEMPAAMGHGAASTRVLSVSSPSSGGVYPYRGGDSITPGVVEAFLNDISAGKVRPWDGVTVHEEGIRHDEL